MTALRRLCGTLWDIVDDSPKKVLWNTTIVFHKTLLALTYLCPIVFHKANIGLPSIMSHSVIQNLLRAVITYVP
jgi:hypothetical protein